MIGADLQDDQEAVNLKDPDAPLSLVCTKASDAIKYFKCVETIYFFITCKDDQLIFLIP